MPKRSRRNSDPGSHHGFLDSVEDDKNKGRKKRQDEDDDDSLDLDRIL